MQPGKSLLKYFAESDLRPAQPPGPSSVTSTTMLTAAEIDDIRGFAEEFTKSGDMTVPRTRLARKPHVRTFLAFLRALGAMGVEETPAGYRLTLAGRLARHVPEIVFVFVSEPLSLIENWNTSHLIPEDSLGAIELLRQFELRRIELTRRAGHPVRPLAHRPVAFAVFHARNSKGQDCYLFEINKDWRRLNFIGGKQEAVDGGDFQATVTREIGEELGVSAERLTLTRLNDEPLKGFGLSGNAGSLASYPCVLFGVTVDGPLNIRMQDRWLTERQIREFRDIPDCPLMVNPVYLDFLLSGTPSRLARTPVSTPKRVRGADTREILPDDEAPIKRWARVLGENKDLLTAMLTLVAALIGVIIAVGR